MRWLHPFDIVLATVVATALLPIGIAGCAAVWTTIVVATTVCARRLEKR